jgi:acetyl esterase
MTGCPEDAAFRTQAISEETRTINEDLARRLAAAPMPADLAAARERFARGGGAIPITPKSPRATTTTIPGKHGQSVGLRIIAPPSPKGVYLNIHGGGWSFGTADMRDGDLERIADRANLACVSVEYRLAPEHPYPAGPDDCEAAALWLIKYADRTFGSTRLLIGGESVGAHLSVVVLLRLRNAGYANAFCGANLNFGFYDLSLTPSASLARSTLLIDRKRLEQFASSFLPAGTDRRVPDVSPLYAELSGLPSALFTVGTLDPLLDDSLFMHARWGAAENAAELAIYPGGVHGFTALSGTLAPEANAKIDAFMAKAAS